MPATLPAATPLRVLRAVVFAVVAFGLGGFAHVVAGGVVPLDSALAAFAVCLAAAYFLAGHERSPAAIAGALTATQVALHLLFAVTDAVAEATGHAQHAHLGLVPDAGMLLMHGWAITLSALWLSRGETLLWSLLRRLVIRLRIVLVLLVDPAVRAVIVRPFQRAVMLRSALIEHDVSRRGPPAAACAHTA
ncbi:MFS transporter [Nonomuraea sp. GTA35]|uniref:MFS transporter n=1 Tax=Nonomuraea sp. GTA35 TaxID=1676746 RepID=UPI0035C0D499